MSENYVPCKREPLTPTFGLDLSDSRQRSTSVERHLVKRQESHRYQQYRDDYDDDRHHQQQQQRLDEETESESNQSSFVKILLRNYQQSAERSLDGPPSSLPRSSVSSTSEAHGTSFGACPRRSSIGRRHHLGALPVDIEHPQSELERRNHRSTACGSQQLKRRWSRMTSMSAVGDAVGQCSSSGTTTSLGRLPFLLQADRTSDGAIHEVCLEGELIASFVVGGEPRLCLPQVLRSVLGGHRSATVDQLPATPPFSLAQINAVCDRLQIHCAASNPVQLEALRRRSVLPPSAVSCGLITLSDAHRLCNALLRCDDGPEEDEDDDRKYCVSRQARSSPRYIVDELGGVPVVHYCFGKCSGVLIEDVSRIAVADDVDVHQVGPVAVCCDQCRRWFGVEQFVGHSHANEETRTCHWGFDAANWRYYVKVLEPFGASDIKIERLRERLERVKSAPMTRISDDDSTTNRTKSIDQSGPESPDRRLISTSAACKLRRCDGDNNVIGCRSATAHASVAADTQQLAHTLNTSGSVYRRPGQHAHCTKIERPVTHSPGHHDDRVSRSGATDHLKPNVNNCKTRPYGVVDILNESSRSSPFVSSVVSILHMQLDLFASALSEMSSVSNMAASRDRRERFLAEFTSLQRKHVEIVKEALTSQSVLQKEVDALRSAVATGCTTKDMEAVHCRQLESLRRDDEAKLMDAQRENEQLKAELEAMIGGAKRSDIGLVKAKYKARAKHFERKFQQIEQTNGRLLDELAALQRTLTLRASGATPRPNQELPCGRPLRTNDRPCDVSASPMLTPSERTGHVATPLSPPLSLGEQSPSTDL